MSAWIGRALVLGLLVFVVFGPLANLALWAAAEQWYFPHKLPVSYGTKFWEQVFKPRGDAVVSLVTSVWIALATVAACLTLAIPAGYALARLKLPWRSAILLAFLMPQAFPSLAVYINIARIFYDLRLNGTMTGVILVHTVHGLVFAVWITAAAFAAVDRDLELAARNLGGSALRTFLTVSLPLAAPGIMASAIFVFL
ncbi:MAG: ABC transporter permease, partial [Burkholderiales bacterium]